MGALLEEALYQIHNKYLHGKNKYAEWRVYTSLLALVGNGSTSNVNKLDENISTNAYSKKERAYLSHGFFVSNTPASLLGIVINRNDSMEIGRIGVDLAS